MWQQIYFWAKKIHRLVMWLALALGIPMTITGVIMESETLSYWVAMGDWGYKVRLIHRLISVYFAMTILTMMATGLLMWLAPKIMARARKVTTPEN